MLIKDYRGYTKVNLRGFRGFGDDEDTSGDTGPTADENTTWDNPDSGPTSDANQDTGLSTQVDVPIGASVDSSTGGGSVPWSSILGLTGQVITGALPIVQQYLPPGTQIPGVNTPVSTATAQALVGQRLPPGTRLPPGYTVSSQGTVVRSTATSAGGSSSSLLMLGGAAAVLGAVVLMKKKKR